MVVVLLETFHVCFPNPTLLIRTRLPLFHPALVTCSDDLVLHFTYEEHFNDMTCNHAIATMYGHGTATLVTDGNHTAVRFDGRSYFEVGATKDVASRDNDVFISVRYT